MLGNSLLLEGVEFPGLSRDLRPEIEARRFVVDNTSYLDWYYGIRSLLRRGARPGCRRTGAQSASTGRYPPAAETTWRATCTTPAT